MEKESGSIFDKIGLGNIAPHVKNGLDVLSEEEKNVVITNIISCLQNTDGSFLTSSNKYPPLGNLQDAEGVETSLDSKRMLELKGNLSSLFKQINSEQTQEVVGRFQKISILFNLIKGLFDNFSHFDNRASASNYNRLKL